MFFIGLAILSVGALILFFLGRVPSLRRTGLNAKDNQITLTWLWLGLIPIGKELVGQVQAIKIAEKEDQDGKSYRIELETETGPLTLRQGWSGASSRPRMDQTVERSEAFLQTPEASSLKLYKTAMFGIFFSAIFIAIGIGTMLLPLLEG